MTPDVPNPSSSPIADLTYRSYDGPLNARTFRAWIVALAGIRQSLRKKGFWVVVVLACFPYLITAVSLYLTSRTQGMTGGRDMNPMNIPMPGQRFSSQFFQAYSFQNFFLFILTLLVGASAIAADNQANALLVYLSKPITKGDYLFGKWLGVFMILFAVAAGPALILYGYCLLSYTGEGFLKDEPWLILRIFGACAVPAAVFSGLMMGFSAWAKTPRMAGAFFAGFYFISNIVAGAFWGIKYRGNLANGILERHLSVDGVIVGLVQNVYGVAQRTMQGNRRFGSMEQLTLEPPRLVIMLGLALALIAVGLLAARIKIRAVEVVRG